MNPEKRPIIALITLAASLITIFAFITGIKNLPQIKSGITNGDPSKENKEVVDIPSPNG